MRFSVFVGLVGEGASRTMGVQEAGFIRIPRKIFVLKKIFALILHFEFYSYIILVLTFYNHIIIALEKRNINILLLENFKYIIETYVTNYFSVS